MAMSSPHRANSESLVTGSPRSKSKPTPRARMATAAVDQHSTRNSRVSAGGRLESRGSFWARAVAEADMFLDRGAHHGRRPLLGSRFDALLSLGFPHGPI